MEMNYKKFISCLIIILEIGCVWYLYPKERLLAAFDLEQLMSYICLDTKDMVVAHRRATELDYKDIGIGAYVMVYYADLLPKPGKDYLIRFGPLSSERRENYLLEANPAIKFYIKNDYSWENIRAIFKRAAEDFSNNSEQCYGTARTGYNHFTDYYDATRD